MNLSDLLARHDKAAATLARLHALPAELEAKRDTLLTSADLDAAPSAELQEISTKLAILPRKTEQAEKELEAAAKELRTACGKEAARLDAIGRARRERLKASIAKTLKPFIADFSTPSRENLLHEIAAESADYAQIAALEGAGIGAYGQPSDVIARQLIVLAEGAKE